jgi:DNA/RNA-binding domain of Phe-tRNA-synthetase-like protein
MFTASDEWKSRYPGAAAGFLALTGVSNPREHDALDKRKAGLEAQLRTQYAGYDRAALRELPRLQAYHLYYKRFKKTYHVQLQLESILLKGKSIPRVAALVEAMFMAELGNLLLTAGHHLGIVEPPVGIDVASGSESFVRINGQEQQLKAGDMFIADAAGVLSSVIYGPDQRTRIRSGTERVLFTVYAPPGIGTDAVQGHLEDIRDNVLVFAPAAETLSLEVLCADSP